MSRSGAVATALVAIAMSLVALAPWPPPSVSASLIALDAAAASSTVSPSSILGETAMVSASTAVLHGVARLPCDLRPPTPGDKVALVIWYKGGITSPIYSVDARERSVQQQWTHWADERVLGGRSFFRVADITEEEEEEDDEEEDDAEVDVTRGTHLAIESVRESDGGSYRCRVDFRRSPTRNAIVNLTVIVPPQNLTLLDEEGRVLEGATLGPFAEGAMLHLVCRAEGGRPAADVSWWRDGVPLAEAAPLEVLEALEEEGPSRSALRVGPLARADLGAAFQCRASNNDLLPPLIREVFIDMTLPALWLRLVGANRPLSTQAAHDVQCQAVGGRPPPRISWRKGGVPLLGARQTTSADGNVTTSTLSLVPAPADLGRDLECSAAGGAATALRDSWRLDVRYPPEVSLEIGANLNASFIREGDDVYFECIVRAHPWVYKVVWTHKGRPLHNNASAGIILSNQTLVLQSVRNDSSGAYACIASNAEGDGESPVFFLDVKYAPVCRAGQQRVYGAARGEQLQVSCEVDANPPATLFRWSFNSSAVAARAVPASAVAVAARGGGGAAEGGGGGGDALLSTAAYAPRAEADYGTLLCWGRNALGAQRAPCVFHVVPAGRPEAPRGCALRNRTWSALQVACARGFDGGLPQRFTLEVFEGAGAAGAPGAAGRGRLVANVTAKAAPEFTVTGLEAGAAYVLHLYASNGKGRSEEAVTLRASTLRAGAQEPRRTGSSYPEGGTEAGPPGSPLLWALAGAGAALTLAGAAAAGAALLRARGLPPPCARCCADDDDEDARSSEASPSVQRARALKGAQAAAAAAAEGERARGPLAQGEAPPKGSTVLPHSPLPLQLPLPLTTPASDDALDNPDVVPHANELDLQSSAYKALDKRSLGSTRTHSADSSLHAPLYVSLHSYSRATTTESLLSFEPVNAGTVRWQPSPSLRDMATQAQPPPPPLPPPPPPPVPTSAHPLQMQPQPLQQSQLLGMTGSRAHARQEPANNSTLRLNVETQTPATRHKESAV